MLNKEILNILRDADGIGWVMEPEAKRMLSLAGLDVPRSREARSLEEALLYAEEIGYPVVAKIVSPEVLHKSDVGGVITGIESDATLKEAFSRLGRLAGFRGVLLEEMVAGGVELIVGAKMDYQFGPVVLLGMGGTGVEIYGDTSLRMPPLDERVVLSMVKDLKAHRLLEGYRGTEAINLQELTQMMIAFSDLVMQLEEQFESIDLNPVICSQKRCVVADARIMLKTDDTTVHVKTISREK
jgi:succinyl-CoA synthetase beta subunit